MTAYLTRLSGSRELAEELTQETFYQAVKNIDRFDGRSSVNTWLYHDLSEKGVEISGGEVQKIALARALYKGSPVIVLDEPTAALDPIAEAQVYAGFSGMVEDRTAVYISHRLSSCQFCDEITVFDTGRIVQQGTHAELLENPEGKYRELWDAQAQYYVEQ